VRAIQKIPKHLKRFTLKQNYNLYTSIDHAGWRFIMLLSKDFFKDHAHRKYLTGLPATGISTEEIPRIEDMDRCLKKLGWRAAVVSGFIPPAVFLEFLSLGILPIACDMRTLSHLHYTPAPDIVHEAAGHAPILADPEYANYIRKYGEISQKVIFSAEDLAVYNAIRKLSDLKEDPHSTEAQVQKANQELEEAIRQSTIVSEATQLSRMAWWTIEYGLVGSLEQPLIYGAGLLSSVGESYDCFVKNVKKVPLTIDCINVSYDITKPQPQLFVTPNFQHLVDVLDEFSLMMAYKNGAEKGIKKALEARTVTTCQWGNDIQVSGVLTDAKFDDWKRPSFIKWKGPCQISSKGREIKGFGPRRFSEGLESVTGSLTAASAKEMKKQKLSSKPKVDLTFENGFRVKGKISEVIKTAKGIQAFVLSQAAINDRSAQNVLIVLNDKITSVFGEAADRASYYDVVPFMHEPTASQKSNLTASNRQLNELYAQVREIRKRGAEKSQNDFLNLIDRLKDHPDEWLIRMELLELGRNVKKLAGVSQKIYSELQSIKRQNSEQSDLIDRGLKILA